MSDGVHDQKRNLPLLVSRETCSGKVYIVTGANSGLGLEAAKHLTNLGSAKVILAVRSLKSGESAKAEIEAATGTSGIAEVWQLDLSSYDSVKAFARRANAELERIDAVIENAAVAQSSRDHAEGHLAAVTVNVLSTFLLGVLILPKLKETARKFGVTPHLTFVSSRVGFTATDDWEAIKDDPFVKMDDENFASMKSYRLTKLMETFIVRYFAPNVAPIEKTGVVVNVICPGLCVTALDRNAPQQFKDQLAKLREQYGRTAEDGSRTLLHGAVAGKESHGRLLHSCEDGEADVPDWVKDDTTTPKFLWDLVAKELEATAPGCVAGILQ